MSYKIDHTVSLVFQVILNNIFSTEDAIHKTKIINEVIDETKDGWKEASFTRCTKQLIEGCLAKYCESEL